MGNLNYLERLYGYLNNQEDFSGKVREFASRIRHISNKDRHVWIIGNGGSSSLANHFATDLCLVKSFHVSAISLASNASILTAVGNDFDFQQVFSAQIRKSADPDDLLVAISSSGNSPNILEALRVARDMGLFSFGVLGFDGGKAKELVNDYFLVHSATKDYGPTEDIHSVFLHATREELESH
jgi:D-sedoheptulose 7-phosphate isomerase